LETERLLREVEAVQIRDLELATRRGAERTRERGRSLVVEVEARDGVVALRLRRLLFEPDHHAPLVELGHAVGLGVLHPVPEDRRATLSRRRALEELGQVLAVEDVVAEDERRGRPAQEVLADDERLREPVGAGLYGVVDLDPPLAPVEEETLEELALVRRGDDQDLPNARLK